VSEAREKLEELAAWCITEGMSRPFNIQPRKDTFEEVYRHIRRILEQSAPETATSDENISAKSWAEGGPHPYERDE
jgi:hypothetical protein